MNSIIWAVLRRFIRHRRGRMPPAKLPDPIWYFAFGSNMNERLFRERRHMTWVEARAGRLHGYRLAFTVGGGMKPGVSARRWLPWLGAAIGIATLAWMLRSLDLEKFRVLIANADAKFILAVPVAVAAEQLLRAWKWRQLLYPLRSIATFRLFGAIMAGALAGLLVPFGLSTIARAWLVGERERVPMSAVLATIALDRLSDGIVFALLVPVALLLVVFPDPSGDIRGGLTWAAAASLLLCTLLTLALVLYKRRSLHASEWVARLIERLPARTMSAAHRIAASFGEGIVWPRELWRGIAIIVSSVGMKLLAATHFLWAGLAFGIALAPAHYLFLMVCLGFVVVLGRVVRIAGTFLIGALFVLGLLGVSEETALAMTLIVQASTLLTISAVGAFALWLQGIALSDLRAGRVEHAAARPN